MVSRHQKLRALKLKYEAEIKAAEYLKEQGEEDVR